MVSLRKNWWKILILALIATFIDIAGHIIEGTPLPDNEPLSIISRSIGIEAAASIYFIIFFSGISITFLIIEKWFIGSKIIKGIKFGISWAIIMFIGVCEINTLLGTSVIADIRMAFIDAIPLIVLGILLGKFFISEAPKDQSCKKNNILSFLVIILFFIIGRYFAYSILKIESGFSERPFSTFIWTLSMGISFGILYITVGRHVSMKSRIKRALYFGFIITGISWFVFNLFWPFIFSVSVWRLIHNIIIGRAIIDIVFITLGTYIGESLMDKKTAEISYSK